MTPTRHDRESIARSALEVLDRVGLPDLSMRRLATELDVQASALYWHFRNKQALLAAVADLILENVPRVEGESDPAAVARRIRDALLTYRDGAEVVMSTYALGLGSTHAQETLRAVLGDDDLRADALYEFLLGHVTLLQQRMHAHSSGALDDGPLDPVAGLDAVFEAGLAAFTGTPAPRT